MGPAKVEPSGCTTELRLETLIGPGGRQIALLAARQPPQMPAVRRDDSRGGLAAARFTSRGSRDRPMLAGQRARGGASPKLDPPSPPRG
jgi:hypothetical protein